MPFSGRHRIIDTGGDEHVVIVVGDLFYDEDLSYAVRLIDAGVPCKVDLIPGAFHGFDMVAAKAAVSKQFLDKQCENLRTGLGLPSHIEK